MIMEIAEELRYPIGRYRKPEQITPEMLRNYQHTIQVFPMLIKNTVEDLTDAQLDTPYRPEGWTVRQLVHHCADSHLNAYTRIKLALTEDKPVIKPYNEKLWAELSDSTLPILPSLMILGGIHHRWSVLLQELKEEQWERVYIHPEQGREFSIKEVMALYDWHCKHHFMHMLRLKETQGW